MVDAQTKRFPQSKIYRLGSQMQCSAVLILSNVAEGLPHQHSGEFRQFLLTAPGSAAELDTQHIFAVELEYATAEEPQPMMDLLSTSKK